MNSPIITNKLSCDFQYLQIDVRYDIFRIQTDDTYFKSGAYILDVPLLEKKVCSVLFEKGNSFYVLMEHNTENKFDLKQIFSQCEEKEKITIFQEKSSLLPDYVIVQLLFNGLGNYQTDFLKFNNLTGHLYCFHPTWLQKGKRNGAEFIYKIPCLELKIDEQNILHLSVHTFTSQLLRSKMKFGKKKYDDYPKYVYGANNTLRRQVKGETETCFIMRQTDGAKSEIPFLNLQSLEQFEATKVGVLADFLNLFHEKYKDIANLEFEKVQEYISIGLSARMKRENNQKIIQVLSERKIRIVDQIQDQYSQYFCECVRDTFERKFDIRPEIGKRISNDAYNVCVIHNLEYYLGKDDPHSHRYNNAVVQHITFEDFNKDSEFAVSTIVNELQIKNDLRQKKISLFDWESLNLKDDLIFGISDVIAETTRYFFMRIHPDGSFAIEESKLDLFSMDDYSECVRIFDSGKLKSAMIKGIIKTADGKINIIKDMNWITLPELFQIQEELKKGNNKLRGKEKREQLLTSCLDIKSFEKDGNIYYFVGEIGEGMRPSINRAANIRQIECYRDAPNIFESLLPLMNVLFVKNGQLTVIPFPFKYLREYTKTI